MSGNEAIAWAVKSLGVDLVTGYAGLPCTSVINTLKDITTAAEMDLEWSGNEKIALETAFGVSISGGRAMTVQKMAGLNVALDSLMVINLLGSAGGLVLAVGDVPGSIFSGNEQDSRALGAFAELPMLEPSTPQEGFDFTVQAFQLSEKFGLPVILRFAKQFALAKGPVNFGGDLKKETKIISAIQRSFAPAAKRVAAHKLLHQKNQEVAAYYAGLSLNQTQGQGDKAIVSCGYTYIKVREALEAQAWPQACKLIKLGALNPMPRDFLTKELQGVREILVIEEIEPYLEEKLRNLVGLEGLPAKVYGKTTGHAQWEGELSAQHIALSLEWFLGRGRGGAVDFGSVPVAAAGNELPGFCEGCPYDYYFGELKKFLADKRLPRPVFTGEPGCSIYLEAPPYEMLDVKVSLGSAIAVACGLAKMQKDRTVVAIVGDSSFFHSEVASLIYAAHGQADIIAMVVYNHTAGVTGRQPNPATGWDLRGEKAEVMEIARIAQACGAPYVRTIKGRDQAELREAFSEVFGRKGTRVLILDDPCTLI
ncbi:MAG: thiamine pyrophosphate-dependent enzyme [Thermodesulfobacteriota bacterium]